MLGRGTRSMLGRHWPAGSVAIPAIVFWEVGLLCGSGRYHLPVPVRDWRARLIAAGANEAPLDGNIALRAAELTGFHGDPADRFIVATALVHGAVLVTADERLLAWRHGLERHDART
jgi:PIN domain nuclease of toxin-antitoxin system